MVKIRTQYHTYLAKMLAVATTAVAITGMAAGSAAGAAVRTSASAPMRITAIPGASVGTKCPVSDAELVVLGTNFTIWWCKWVSGTGNTVGLGPFQAMTFATGFDRRVWFHENADGTGWADCFFTGGTGVSVNLKGRDQNPGNIQVTTNHSACP